MRCGSYRTETKKLEQLVYTYKASGRSVRRINVSKSSQIPSKIGIDIVWNRRIWQSAQESFRAYLDFRYFVDIVDSIGRGNCADEHDRIYALLPLDETFSTRIQPDYSKTIRQVFSEFCDAQLDQYLTMKNYSLFMMNGMTVMVKLRAISEMLGLDPESEEVDRALQSFIDAVQRGK
ncbi:hypothetical protein E8E12_004050 [Didymella heteroderae]|uniref:Uncharacterized protein n=1 Tax=Didymella heteroderae TaxID=1769908 RepID=A0A9P4WKG9_9PLEO|nr:hypothetical protein E8E12_004050 [Didymella heteroderae]